MQKIQNHTLLLDNILLTVGYKDYIIKEKNGLLLENVNEKPIEADGMFLGSEQEIHYQKGLSPQNTARIILHEIIHAIDDTFSMELDEDTVNRLACGFTLLFRENPDVMKKLIVASGQRT